MLAELKKKKNVYEGKEANQVFEKADNIEKLLFYVPLTMLGLYLNLINDTTIRVNGPEKKNLKIYGSVSIALNTETFETIMIYFRKRRQKFTRIHQNSHLLFLFAPCR